MARELIAFPRRERVLLAVVQSEDVGPGGMGRLSIVAEDGAKFALPADQVIARFPWPAALAPGAPPRDVLAAARRDAGPAVAWREVHAALPAGASLPFEDIAVALGIDGDAPRLALALALGESDPWLRRNGMTWTVVAPADAEARLAAAEAQRRAAAEDEAVRAWWPQRAASAPPADAAGAFEALVEFARRGEDPRAERGRLLAAHVECSDPDQLLEALVACGILPEDENPAPWRAGLGDPFSAKAAAEAGRAALAPPDPAGREDLTALFTVAIDDDGTVEADDAISVRTADGGVEVLVHISDVAAAIPPGSPLDRAARERCSSLYLPEGPVTMLPRDIVGRLSLDAGVLREAVTGVFLVAPDGKVARSRFVRSLVRVTRRATYEETADAAALAASPEDARRLVDAACALRAARIARGAIVTNLPQAKFRAADGRVTISHRSQHTAGDLVVAEAAVLFNAEAGRLLAARDAAAFFRVQDAPKGADPDPANPLHQVHARRRFAPTSLRVEAGRHHGVGVDAYAQTTSPMRRFADLVNQRQLAALAAGAPPVYRPADLETLAEHVVVRERAVRRASADREAYWFAKDVLARGVASVEGILSRAPRRGLGGVWVPELLTELPLRAPDGWRAPPEGTRAAWRIGRVLPWRGRVEVEPADAAGSPR